MKAKPDTTHVRYSETGELICRRCGFRETVERPVPVREFCRHLMSFVDGHKECPKPGKEGSNDGNSNN